MTRRESSYHVITEETDDNLDGGQNLPTISRLGFTVDILQHFIDECGGRDVISSRSIAYMCKYYVKRFTNSKKVTYCEELQYEPACKANLGPAVVLVSSSSQCNFLEATDLLVEHFLGCGVHLWWDIFCCNLHSPELDITPEW